jgi:hypothetical protein
MGVKSHVGLGGGGGLKQKTATEVWLLLHDVIAVGIATAAAGSPFSHHALHVLSAGRCVFLDGRLEKAKAVPADSLVATGASV